MRLCPLHKFKKMLYYVRRIITQEEVMKGFTLIELMVVVIIIGILSAIALPQYELAVEKSRAAEAMINAKAILDAMQRHDQEFPGEAVTNCSQIADVQLKGGSWGTSCNTSAGTGGRCSGTMNTFSTKNFCYHINGTTLDVSRVDGDDDLYIITYTQPTGGVTPTASADQCGEDYEQVCKLFTDL